MISTIINSICLAMSEEQRRSEREIEGTCFCRRQGSKNDVPMTNSSKFVSLCKNEILFVINVYIPVPQNPVDSNSHLSIEARI